MWQSVAVLFGVLCLIEGALLLFLREDTWRVLRTYLLGLTVGQIHTVGAAILACGIVLVAIGSFL